MEKAYICSPLSGDEITNINNAIAYAKFVYQRCGMIPVMSHLYALILDDKDKAQRELGMSLGLEQILNSHHVWVFGDTITRGMDKEIKNALSLHRPIHHITDYQCRKILNEYGGKIIDGKVN